MRWNEPVDNLPTVPGLILRGLAFSDDGRNLVVGGFTWFMIRGRWVSVQLMAFGSLHSSSELLEISTKGRAIFGCHHYS